MNVKVSIHKHTNGWAYSYITVIFKHFDRKYPKIKMKYAIEIIPREFCEKDALQGKSSIAYFI